MVRFCYFCLSCNPIPFFATSTEAEQHSAEFSHVVVSANRIGE